MRDRCKYPDCGFEGEMPCYVGFFCQEIITEAHKKDERLPQFGYHMGYDCPVCKRWQKWVKQTKDNMLMLKWYVRE